MKNAIGKLRFAALLAVVCIAILWSHLAAQTVQSGNPSPGPVGIISSNVSVCDPYNPQNCLTPAATTNILASGTTGSVVATLPAVPGQTNYLCSIDVEANGGTAAISPLTVSGLFAGSIQLFGPITSSATGASYQKTWTPCLPARIANNAIQVTTTAAAGASAVEVIISGFTH